MNNKIKIKFVLILIMFFSSSVCFPQGDINLVISETSINQAVQALVDSKSINFSQYDGSYGVNHYNINIGSASINLIGNNPNNVELNLTLTGKANFNIILFDFDVNINSSFTVYGNATLLPQGQGYEITLNPQGIKNYSPSGSFLDALVQNYISGFINQLPQISFGSYTSLLPGVIAQYFTSSTPTLTITDNEAILSLNLNKITTSGTLTSNERWYGTINLTSNVTVPSGLNLTIDPGSNVYSANGASLIVNGNLNAIGNSTQKIMFDRNSISGTWGGLIFNSGGTGNLQNCSIQNANNGIYLYNSSPQVSNTTISNCNTGIYCDYYSSPTLSNNLIQSNNYGIWCNGGSSPNLATSGTSGNVIRNNVNNSLYAIYGSNPTLGVSSFGGNSLYGNGTPSVSAIYSSNINAINNWWGSYPPSSALFYSNYGTITYNPALSYNPNYSVQVDNNNITSSTTLNTDLNIREDDLGSAEDKEKDKKYDEAIPLFLQVFRNNTNAIIGKYALSKIEECFTQAGMKDYLDYSKKEIKPLLKDGTETYVMALELDTHQMINAGLYKDAIDNLLTILKRYNLNSYVEKNTLFRLGAFYSQFLGDVKSSDKYFEELKQTYPDDQLVRQIETIKNLGVASNSFAQNTQLMPAEGLTGLSEKNNSMKISNYPNPFNPTTKISFSFPQKSQVKLKVFDVLGREIQILADGVYEAGKYEVEFNATNLPSGVYFYNLTTGSNSITKKMLLIK